MALTKKGSRLIIVDNDKYRWVIRRKLTYVQAVFGGRMTCAVEGVNGGACVLLITFPWSRANYWMPSVQCNHWVDVTSNSVTPKLIEACIRAALKQGWEPSKKGSAFQFNAERILKVQES